MNKIVFAFFAGFLLMIGAGNLQAKTSEEASEEKYSDSTYHSHILPEKVFVRRAKGMYGLGFFGGKSSIGPIAGIEWSYQFLLSSQLKMLGGTEWKTQSYITYRSFFLQPMLYHTFFTNYHNFCVNIGIGSILTYIRRYDERIDHDGKLNKAASNFNVGLIMGGEMELFIFKAVELTLAGGPMVYIFKDPYDRFSYYLSLGLKFNF